MYENRREGKEKDGGAFNEGILTRTKRITLMASPQLVRGDIFNR
jgi:hypothetical protein